MQNLFDLLATVTEETTIEEARRIILEVAGKLEDIRKDTEGYVALVNDQQNKITDLEYEIARLKEENGRIYRERAETIQRNIDAKVAEISKEETEAELIANIDI